MNETRSRKCFSIFSLIVFFAELVITGVWNSILTVANLQGEKYIEEHRRNDSLNQETLDSEKNTVLLCSVQMVIVLVVVILACVALFKKQPFFLVPLMVVNILLVINHLYGTIFYLRLRFAMAIGTEIILMCLFIFFTATAAVCFKRLRNERQIPPIIALPENQMEKRYNISVSPVHKQYFVPNLVVPIDDAPPPYDSRNDQLNF